MAAGGIGFATTFIYIGLIVSQGEPEWGRVWIFALLMALASTFALAAEAVADVSTGRGLLVLSALVFAVVGVLGFFSIGAPFLLAAVVAAVGSARLSDPPSGAPHMQAGGTADDPEP